MKPRWMDWRRRRREREKRIYFWCYVLNYGLRETNVMRCELLKAKKIINERERETKLARNWHKGVRS